MQPAASFVRYLGLEKKIKEEHVVKVTSKRKDVMKIICGYFETHGLEWKKLQGFCSDGTPAMLGSRLGLSTLVKEKNPDTVTIHCIIIRHAVRFFNVMKLAIEMVKSNKASAKHRHIFNKLSAELKSSDHETRFH